MAGVRGYPDNRYVPGTYKRECARCGDDGLRKDMLKEPKTNLIVCKECYDPIHPSDLPRKTHREKPFKRD